MDDWGADPWMSKGDQWGGKGDQWGREGDHWGGKGDQWGGKGGKGGNYAPWDDPWAMNGGKYGPPAGKGWSGPPAGKAWSEPAVASADWGGPPAPPAAGHTWGPPPATPMVLGIKVHPSSQLPAQGFSPEAPVVVFDKNATVFSCASDILGDLGHDIEIEHDADWVKYPEVAEAIKEAGGEDSCVAIAKSPSMGVWAVGLAAGWQGRERAGKAAIGLALAATDRANLERLAHTYPDFGAMCVAAGLLPPDAIPAGGGVGGCCGGGGGARKRAAPDWGPPAVPVGGRSAGDCPPVFWIQMGPSASIVQQGMPPSGLVLSSGGSPYKRFFSNASSIFAEIVGDPSAVTIIDDPDWKHYADVAETIKAAPGGEENCIAVVYSELAGVWAVGLASGKKPRDAAMKMAISLALAPTSPRFPAVLSTYPEFAQLCEAAQIELPGGAEAKRLR